MDRVENEVRAAVVADAWIEQHKGQTVNTVCALTGLAGRSAPAHSHADPSTELTQDPGLEARRVEVRGDYAMVEVWTTGSDIPWLPAPYRQTRFYQETEQGWLPTQPPDSSGSRSTRSR